MADPSSTTPKLPDRSTGPEDKTAQVIAYLVENIPEFRALEKLREEFRGDPVVDAVFEQRKQRADTANADAAEKMFRMMGTNAQELNRMTGGFRITRKSTKAEPHSIVDFCMAPGAILQEAILTNVKPRALAYTLPVDNGGHEVFIRSSESLRVNFLDINMLAEDMGVTVPSDHEDGKHFIPRTLTEGKRSFDIALCDGQVLRTHSSYRASYREQNEALRLNAVQLALGMEHLREGGTIIALLHKVEAWRTMRLLHQFSKFSKVKLFKPRWSHKDRSSFYMVATDIQVTKPEAIQEVDRWKKVWKAATFGSEQDVEEALSVEPTVRELLKDFGEELGKLGLEIWKIQREGLAGKSTAWRAKGTGAKNGR